MRSGLMCPCQGHAATVMCIPLTVMNPRSSSGTVGCHGDGVGGGGNVLGGGGLSGGHPQKVLERGTETIQPRSDG
jgi:hypothetical protein